MGGVVVCECWGSWQGGAYQQMADDLVLLAGASHVQHSARADTLPRASRWAATC